MKNLRSGEMMFAKACGYLTPQKVILLLLRSIVILITGLTAFAGEAEIYSLLEPDVQKILYED
jgi:hypothetical protein